MMHRMPVNMDVAHLMYLVGSAEGLREDLHEWSLANPTVDLSDLLDKADEHVQILTRTLEDNK